MGGCLSCCKEPDSSILLAAYNPLVLGDPVDYVTPTMYTQHLIQPTGQGMSRESDSPRNKQYIPPPIFTSPSHVKQIYI